MTSVLAPALVGLVVGLATLAGLLARGRDASAVAVSRLAGSQDGPVAVVPAWFAAALRRSEITVDPGRAWPVTGAVLLLGVVALGVTRPLIALALGAVVLGVVAVSGHRSRRTEAAAVPEDLERLVDALAAELAAGRSLAQAIDRVPQGIGAVGADLRTARARHRGAPTQTLLDTWAEDRPESGPDLVADALALAGSSGGSQVRALQGVAATLREHRALDREVAALGSQAQASATVLVVTPVLFAVLVGVMDRDIGHFMVATAPGWACLTSGLALDLAGAWWMRHLTAVSR